MRAPANFDAGLATLGLTRQDLVFPLQGPSVDECQRRLAELKARAKKAFRAQALALHPDRTGGDAAKTEALKALTPVAEFVAGLEINIQQRQPQPLPQQGFRVVIINGGGWVHTSSASTTTTGGWGW